MPFTYPNNPFYFPYYLASRYGPSMFRRKFPRNPGAIGNRPPRRRNPRKPRGGPAYIPRRSKKTQVVFKYPPASGGYQKTKFTKSRKNLLTNLGVGSHADKYNIYTKQTNYNSTSSRILWQFVEPVLGLNSKSTYD